MSNATPRAKARTLPKPTKPDGTAKASILRTLASETRRLAALPDKAFEKSEEPAPSAEVLDLRDVSDELGLVYDLVDAAYFAANSLPPGLGKEPMSRLLNLISDKLADARGDLDNIRNAAR